VNHLRQASLLLVAGIFVSFVVPSCKSGDDDTTAEACPRGDMGCRCKANGTCNSDLTCNDAEKCVASAAAGQGGAAATGGNSGRAGGGRAGTEAFALGGSVGHGVGGTTVEGGAGGEPGTGGLIGRGTGGSGGATGQAGEGAAAGDVGTPGSGGAGGSGTGGTGGTGGAGGTGPANGGTGGMAGSNSAGRGGSGGMGGSGAPCTVITTSTLETNLADGNAIFSSVFTPNLAAVDDDAVALQVYQGLISGVNYHGQDIGTFELGTGEDANYSSCSRCVVAGIDGVDKWFFATEGTLTFALDSDQMNGYPHGTLRNVVLREATYDASTFVSTFVPNGQCLSLANGDLLVNVEPPPETWTCVLNYYDDGTWCDCGCGALDPDCGSASASVCEYCYCNPSDDMDCTAVNASQNQTCNL